MHERYPDGRVLRDAERSDLDRIVAICNESIPGRLATADTEPVTVDGRVPWFEAHTPGRRPLWVLTGSDGVDGWASLQDFSFGRPAYDTTGSEHLRRRHATRHRCGSPAARRGDRHRPNPRAPLLIAMSFGHNQSSLRLFTGPGFVDWGRLPEIAVLDGITRDVAILGRGVQV